MTPLQQLQKTAWQKTIPLVCIFELTRRCNLRCRHCYAIPDQGRKELSYDEIKNVIDQLYNLGTLFITFTGGDPTVNKYFMDIVKYASDKRMAIQIFTNGLLINDDWAEKISELNTFYVGLSVYGAVAQTHDNITGRPGSWQKTIDAARRLRDRQVLTVLKYVVMNLNAHEYDAMIKMAKDLGVHYRVGTNIKPRDNLMLDTLALRVQKEQLEHVLEGQFAEKFYKKTIREDRSDFICAAGRTLININAYGDVHPCVALPISAGNVRDLPLVDIWTNGSIFKSLRNLDHLKNLHTCPECELRAHCNRCPGNAYTETKDLYGPEPGACLEAMAMKKIENQRNGIHEEVEPPPGVKFLQNGQNECLPGWRNEEVVELSKIGCSLSA